jgi:uncharacterized phage infection (PIP) family protein YhgE
MGEQNDIIERLNKTVANVEKILPWLHKRLETANKLSADGSPDRARLEESNIQIVAEFYRDRLKTQADEAKANRNSLPADLGDVSKKLDEIIGQTENLRSGITGQKESAMD